MYIYIHNLGSDFKGMYLYDYFPIRSSPRNATTYHLLEVFREMITALQSIYGDTS